MDTPGAPAVPMSARCPTLAHRMRRPRPNEPRHEQSSGDGSRPAGAVTTLVGAAAMSGATAAAIVQNDHLPLAWAALATFAVAGGLGVWRPPYARRAMWWLLGAGGLTLLLAGGLWDGALAAFVPAVVGGYFLAASRMRPGDPLEIAPLVVAAAPAVAMAALDGTTRGAVTCAASVGATTVIAVNLMALARSRKLRRATMRLAIERQRRMVGARVHDDARNTGVAGLVRAAAGLRDDGDDVGAALIDSISSRLDTDTRRVTEAHAGSSGPSRFLDDLISRGPSVFEGAAPEPWSAPASQGSARDRLVPIMNIADVIRLLHDRNVEHWSLHATLWLRAVLVALAPWLGAPWAPEPILPADSPLWMAAAGWSIVTAVLSTTIVPLTMAPERRGFRTALLLVEIPLSAASVVASPSWAAMCMFAGPVNWMQRPTWHLRTLARWAVLAFGSLAVGWAIAHGSPSGLGIQVLASAAALFVISCSYGLMIPSVLATALTRPVTLMLSEPSRARRRERRWNARVDRALRSAESRLMRDAQQGVSAAEARARAVRTLREARVRLADITDRERPAGHDADLLTVLWTAITSRIPPASLDESDSIRATATAFDPPELRQAIVRSRRWRRALTELTDQIAAEAELNGEGLFQSSCSLTDDASIRMVFANDIPSTPPPRPVGARGGARDMAALVAILPGGRILSRGPASGDILGDSPGMTVFAVTIEVDMDILDMAPEG